MTSNNQVYRVAFTWNKPEDVVEAEFETKHVHVVGTLEVKLPDAKFVFQLERGVETHRLHYQGNLKLKTKKRLQEVGNALRGDLPGIHLSVNSNAGSTDAEFYCMKERTRVAGPWGDKNHIFPDYSDIEEPTGWQLQMRDILTGPSDPRTIHWVWETTGKTGKTMFSNWMELKDKAIVLGLGTATDNFYAVSELTSRCYIFDVPRTQPKRWDWAEVYMSMEKIKDRNFLSTKYKPKKVFLPITPHICVFSNQPPDRKLLSDDRWCVWRIVNGTLVQDAGTFGGGAAASWQNSEDSDED